MAIGYLLGGIACLLYFALVGYFGAIKKSPGLLRMVKLKLGKGMSDETAAKICAWAAIIIGLGGVFLLVYGGIVGV